VGVVCKIVPAEPLHHRARQEIALRIFRARGKARILCCVCETPEDVGDGIDQQLACELDAGVAAGDGRRCRKIAARAVAGDAKPVRVATELVDAARDIA
jgi:hypothetical protein